jgi:hypothetical protein
MRSSGIYNVSGVANVKKDLIENLRKYQNLFQKFKDVLETDDELKSLFHNSIENIDEAIKIIQQDTLNVFKIKELLIIIRKHMNSSK